MKRGRNLQFPGLMCNSIAYRDKVEHAVLDNFRCKYLAGSDGFCPRHSALNAAGFMKKGAAKAAARRKEGAA